MQNSNMPLDNDYREDVLTHFFVRRLSKFNSPSMNAFDKCHFYLILLRTGKENCQPGCFLDQKCFFKKDKV